MSNSPLHDLIKKQATEIERLRTKLLQAQAHCYELLDMEPGMDNIDLKAQNYYLQQELKRVIAQRDKLRKGN